MVVRRIGQHSRMGGFSLIELLIAVLITGIVAAAAFHFYVQMNQQVVTQQEISDMQQLSRATLQEMGKTLRMAGYMVPDHAPYRINGCSLAVYYSFTGNLNDVDSVLYYLEEFNEIEYLDVPHRPAGLHLYKVMKKVSSDPAETFSDFVTSIQYNVVNVDSSEVAITLEVQTSRADEDYLENDGFRRFVNTERVNMRNANL
ncbi:MAG: prepilin-type N-terminal cleavage/methylation domain-containing protein [Candidatus Zixiibacteriota bacterium]|nr:MAG: prepilin-type N-terminal cleavage/methylation domain-containing protein [candidate division Zixibacteria bacterium]